MQSTAGHMIDEYDYPREMPRIRVDDDGIVNVWFGNLQITPAHVVHGVDIQRKLCGVRKMPVMIAGEVAPNIQGDITRVGGSDWVVDVTAALALVTKHKIARVLANIFMAIQSNPYPTKVFDCEEDAREWLIQYR